MEWESAGSPARSSCCSGFYFVHHSRCTQHEVGAITEYPVAPGTWKVRGVNTGTLTPVDPALVFVAEVVPLEGMAANVLNMFT